MWALLAPAWHLDLLVTGLVVGAVATVLALVVSPAPSPAALAAVAAIGALVPTRLAPWWLAVAMAVVAVATRGARRGLAGSARGALAGGAVVLGGPTLPLAATVLLVGLVGLTVVTGARPAVRTLPPGGVEATLLGGSVAVWLCTPDTEAIVVVGAALAAPLVAAIVTRHGSCGGGWTVPALVVIWAGAEGFRGRTAGLVALVPILAAAVGWSVVRSRVRVPPRVGWAVAVAASALSALVAARTIGLASAATAATVAGAGVLTAVSLLAWSAAPGPARPVADDDGARRAVPR